MNELYSVCFNVTSKCNEKCKFCFRKKCKDNTLAQNKKILDNLLQTKIGKLTFSGGNPYYMKTYLNLPIILKLKNQKSFYQ